MDAVAKVASAREGGIAPEAAPEHGSAQTDEEGALAAEGESAGEAGAEQEGEAGERNADGRRRRRGRRGGRRNRRGRDGEAPRTASDSTGGFDGDQGAESSEHDHTREAPIERHETERHETYAAPPGRPCAGARVLRTTAAGTTSPCPGRRAA